MRKKSVIKNSKELLISIEPLKQEIEALKNKIIEIQYYFQRAEENCDNLSSLFEKDIINKNKSIIQ